MKSKLVMNLSTIILAVLCLIDTTLAQDKPAIDSSGLSAISKSDSINLTTKAIKFAKVNIEVIKPIITQYVEPVAVEVLSNDKIMRSTFETTYEFMPFAMKLVICREDFVLFCLKHRWKLVTVISIKEKK